jgi:protein-tyrosine phosphatase
MLPEMSGVFRVLFVCAGNICRSPMAEGIFRKLLRERGLTEHYEVDSAGTGDWHRGEDADPRTLRVLKKHGADFDHVARQVQPSDTAFDLILAADHANLRDLRYLLPTAKHKTFLILGSLEVPDPYYSDLAFFERLFTLLEPALAGLLDDLEAQRAERTS